MQPRTKKEFEITELSEKLPPLTEKQITFIKEKCFKKTAFRTKHTLTCMCCGEKITYTDKRRCTCEKCGANLVVENTLNRVRETAKYHGIVTTAGNYQILRFFIIKKYEKKGQKATYFYDEVIRHFIDENGKDTLLALTCYFGGLYYDSWNYGSKMTLKLNRDDYYFKHKYFVNPLTFDYHFNVLPKLRRNGLKKSFHDVNPTELCCSLLSNNKIETLWKAGQYKMAEYYMYAKQELIGSWPEIKILLRNKYIVKDVQMWNDYISSLTFFNKDCRNAFYICPKNLKEAHDFWLKKRQIRERKMEEEAKKRKFAAYETEFRNIKGKYVKLCLKQKNIEISALKNVKQYVEEADAMHHCVYENEYFLKPDSLVLSARVNGKRAETVEVSLQTGKVLQSRAKYNGTSKHHKAIVSLVNRQFINKLKAIK